MIILLFLILFMHDSFCFKKKDLETKKSVFSGLFYPENKNELNDLIAYFFSKTDFSVYGFDENSIRAIISPHAGYIYSGQIAANAFYLLNDIYNTVFIIAPSHSHYFNGASILNVDYFETPLGKVNVSNKIYDLLNKNVFKSIEKAYLKEHSLEVQLPFLQKKLKNFEIVPIVYGNINPEKLSNELIDFIDEKTLIVVSSDLSHYYDYETANIKDNECINSILEMNLEKLSKCEACGLIGIIALVNLAKKFGWLPILIKKGNSADSTGQMDRVVGYTSIVFYDPKFNSKKSYLYEDNENVPILSLKEKKKLLILARRTLENYFKGIDIVPEEIIKITKNLNKMGRCFVTLNKNGQLRGCIGNFNEKKLYEAVVQNVKSAAFNDSRFSILKESELNHLEIEISVLSDSKKLEFKDKNDLISKLRPGIDGVIVKSKNVENSATYLPQVWDQFKNAEKFLSSLCLKAGIAEDSWKNPKIVEIYIYSAEVFTE